MPDPARNHAPGDAGMLEQGKRPDLARKDPAATKKTLRALLQAEATMLGMLRAAASDVARHLRRSASPEAIATAFSGHMVPALEAGTANARQMAYKGFRAQWQGIEERLAPLGYDVPPAPRPLALVRATAEGTQAVHSYAAKVAGRVEQGATITQATAREAYRLERIATTETAKAVQSTQHELAERAATRVKPPKVPTTATTLAPTPAASPEIAFYKVWDATLDERTCAACRELNGYTTSVHHPFPRGETPGWVHPGDRCIERIVEGGPLPGTTPWKMPPRKVEGSVTPPPPPVPKPARKPKPPPPAPPAPKPVAPKPSPVAPAPKPPAPKPPKVSPAPSPPASPPKPVAQPSTPAPKGLQYGVHYKNLRHVASVSTERIEEIVAGVTDPDILKYLEAHPLDEIVLLGAKPGLNGEWELEKDLLTGAEKTTIRLVTQRNPISWGRGYGAGLWGSSQLGKDELDAIQRTLHHEIGHHVHMHDLHSSAVPNTYAVVDDIISTAFRKHTVGLTQYGDTDSKEYFAECFNLWHYEPALLKQADPIGHKMVKDVLKERGMLAKGAKPKPGAQRASP